MTGILKNADKLNFEMPHDVLHSNSVIIPRTIHNSIMFFTVGFAIVKPRPCLDSWSEEFVIVQEEVVFCHLCTSQGVIELW